MYRLQNNVRIERELELHRRTILKRRVLSVCFHITLLFIAQAVKKDSGRSIINFRLLQSLVSVSWSDLASR